MPANNAQIDLRTGGTTALVPVLVLIATGQGKVVCVLKDDLTLSVEPDVSGQTGVDDMISLIRPSGYVHRTRVPSIFPYTRLNNNQSQLIPKAFCTSLSLERYFVTWT